MKLYNTYSTTAMFPYIVCPSCGFPIGSLWPAFSAIRADMHLAALREKGIDPKLANLPMLESNEGVTVAMGEVLTGLGIRSECCRVKMLTQVLFKDVY